MEMIRFPFHREWNNALSFVEKWCQMEISSQVPANFKGQLASVELLFPGRMAAPRDMNPVRMMLFDETAYRNGVVFWQHLAYILAFGLAFEACENTGERT
ncbi:hypothetical protein VFPPC_17426 [Pochonia chlamydosporia 170]|uniref:Uncharacterized protein n=1 Tax=Pochonia chlamydosporia 170 TaxID=1380566 RepID=A0A219ATB4_METCM|nr:hypothetical protein VFPPC_17426 [Pochonia chlamydosporia 170]OWT43425.1 hypothetical protein VFPPC_17426 [Pochonia chlamydosporia 170]